MLLINKGNIKYIPEKERLLGYKLSVEFLFYTGTLKKEGYYVHDSSL